MLIKRPPDRHKLMELRVKDLRDYLNKNNISTYGLVEKNELVDLFCNKYIPEKQRKGVDKLTANFGDPLNGLFNNIESVITERNGARPTTVPAPPPPHRTQSVPVTPQRVAPTPPQSQPHTVTPSAPPFEPPNEQPTTSQGPQHPDVTPDSSPLPQRHPKLHDFTCAEELSELSSKQLKILLTINRVEFRGCIEKGNVFIIVYYARL